MADETIVQARACTKCGVIMPRTLDYFYPHRRMPDGLMPRCRACHREDARERRLRDPEGTKATKRREYERHRAAYLERSKASYRAKMAAKAAAEAVLPTDELERREALRQERCAAVRQRRIERQRDYYRKNRAKVLAAMAERRKRLKPSEEQKARYREAVRRWWRVARKRPRYLISRRVRARVRDALLRRGMGGPGGTVFRRFDYTVEDLVVHIERQFLSGMTWENYGKWHIDHIVPESAFSFTSLDDPEFLACWALTNLRPMWAKDNVKKGNRRLSLL